MNAATERPRLEKEAQEAADEMNARLGHRPISVDDVIALNRKQRQADKKRTAAREEAEAPWRKEHDRLGVLYDRAVRQLGYMEVRADQDPLNIERQLELMGAQKIVEQQAAKLEAHERVRP